LYLVHVSSIYTDLCWTRC